MKLFPANRRRWRYWFVALLTLIGLGCGVVAWERRFIEQRRAYAQELRSRGYLTIWRGPSEYSFLRRTLGGRDVQGIFPPAKSAETDAERAKIREMFPELAKGGC